MLAPSIFWVYSAFRFINKTLIKSEDAVNTESLQGFLKGIRAIVMFLGVNNIVDWLGQFFFELHKEQRDKKAEARKIYNDAIEDVRDNGAHIRVFKLDALRSLVSYDGLYALNQEDKEKMHNYISIAARCNDRNFKSLEGVTYGAINGRQSQYLQMLEEYKKRIV